MSNKEQVTKTEGTKIVSYKNGLLIGDAQHKVRMSDVTKADLPKGAITFFVNKQGMSATNRMKIEALSEGQQIVNNTMSPINDDLEAHFKGSQIAKTSRTTTMEMSEEHIKQLTTLMETYNKATLTKQLIKLSIKL